MLLLTVPRTEMVHVCCVPGCSNRSDREHHLSFFGLPLKKKKPVLKQWIHRIGRKTSQSTSTLVFVAITSFKRRVDGSTLVKCLR